MALTLRVVGGLTSDEIARAFLVPTATVQARITRAKKTLGAARVPFEVPLTGAGGAARLGPQRHLPDLHRGVVGQLRRRADPRRSGGRGAAAGAGAGPADAGRAGGARPAGAAGADRGAVPRPHRAGRRAGAAGAPGPRPLGPRRDRPRPRRWPARGAGRLRAAGGDRRVPCGRPVGRRDRLGPDRGPLRGARAAGAVPGGGVEPGGGGVDGAGTAAALPIVDGLAGAGALAGSHLLPTVRGELLTRLGRTGEARASWSAPRGCAATSASGRCWSASSPPSAEPGARPAGYPSWPDGG